LKLWAEGEGLRDFLTVNEKRAGAVDVMKPIPQC
jgi:hypothetical protein